MARQIPCDLLVYRYRPIVVFDPPTSRSVSVTVKALGFFREFDSGSTSSESGAHAVPTPPLSRA